MSGATALAESKLSHQHWVIKHGSGFCGTAKMMFLWKKQASQSCLWCGFEVEDTTHVLQCLAPGAWEVWEQSVMELRKWFNGQLTNLEICDAICKGL